MFLNLFSYKFDKFLSLKAGTESHMKSELS